MRLKQTNCNYPTISDGDLADLLIQRIIKNPALLKDHRFSNHNKTYLASFARQEQVDRLFFRRWELTQEEYFKELDAICKEDMKLLDKEVNKYLKWAKSKRRMSQTDI